VAGPAPERVVTQPTPAGEGALDRGVAAGRAPDGRQAAARALVERLAASEDPVIAYKARVLVCGLAEDAPEAQALRSRIAGSPRAQALLAHRAADGTITTNPYKKWQGPHWTLYSLAQIDYPPGDEGLRPLLDQVLDWLLSRDHLRPPRSVVVPGQEDRVRRCASQEGNAIWYALRLGLPDERIGQLVDRLVGWQWPDGGWNCDKRPAAHASSFQETALPLRALWAFGRRHGRGPALAAVDRAAELLLSRRLLWRRTTGALLDLDWGGPVDRISYPIQFYDVLFALQVMAEIGRIGDPRCADALALLAAKQLPDGGFPLEEQKARTSAEVVSRGSHADWGPAGRRRSNPLVSLVALGVLRAAGGAGAP
jgi:hypothetical protein